MQPLSVVASVALVAAVVGLGVLCLRLYRRLDRWYAEDPSNYWKQPDPRQTLPVLGAYFAVMGCTFVTTWLWRLVPVWLAVSVIVCSTGGLVAFRIMKARAYEAIEEDPRRYPPPVTPPERQGRVAAMLLGGMVIVIGALVLFLVALGKGIGQ